MESSRLLSCILVATCAVVWSHERRNEPTINDQASVEFLMKYGYLRSNNVSGLQEVTTANGGKYKQALQKFQHMVGIPATGKLDQQTRYYMSLPRCGCPDIEEEESTARRKKRFVLFNVKWRKNPLSYTISKYSTRQMTRGQQDIETARAFNHWSSAANIDFLRQTAGRGDIDLRFEVRSHGDANPFDGPSYLGGRVLAHAGPPPTGIVHFDDEENYTFNTTRGINYMQIATHELGHALGLGHSNVRNSVMFPMHTGNQLNFQLHPDDIAGIQAHYGRRLTSPSGCDCRGWQAWSSCTRPCGGGSRSRSRSCQGQCIGFPSSESQNCNTQQCGGTGGCQPFCYNWGLWPRCPVTCGGATIARQRQCPFRCPSTSTYQTQRCNGQSCDPGTYWTNWSAWSSCGTTCGSGVRQRHRVCIGNSINGRSCPGARSSVSACINNHPCFNSGWQTWSSCSASCGSGTRTRQYGQTGLRQHRTCWSRCPVSCWSSWINVTQCTRRCGGGRTVRMRTCRCNICGGSNMDLGTCNEFPCRG